MSTYFSSIARHLSSSTFLPPIDIKADIEFKRVREVLKIRCRQVTADGARPGMNASRAISDEHIKEAFRQGSLGRSNPDALVTTCQYVIQTGMGIRAIRECWSIKNCDLVHGPPHRKVPGMPAWIELSERLTKTRQGQKNLTRDLEGRIYLDLENPEICPVRTLFEYHNRKNDSQKGPDCWFFLGVNHQARRQPQLHPIWFVNCRMGRNTLQENLKKAMEKIGVNVENEHITATSARKQMIQAGADGEVPGAFISMMAGQKSISSKLSYLKQKEKSHKAAQMVINRKACGLNSGTNFSNVYKSLNKQEEDEQSRVDETESDDENEITISQSRMIEFGHIHKVEKEELKFSRPRSTSSGNSRCQNQPAGPLPPLQPPVPSSTYVPATTSPYTHFPPAMYAPGAPTVPTPIPPVTPNLFAPLVPFPYAPFMSPALAPAATSPYPSFAPFAFATAPPSPYLCPMPWPYIPYTSNPNVAIQHDPRYSLSIMPRPSHYPVGPSGLSKGEQELKGENSQDPNIELKSVNEMDDPLEERFSRGAEQAESIMKHSKAQSRDQKKEVEKEMTELEKEPALPLNDVESPDEVDSKSKRTLRKSLYSINEKEHKKPCTQITKKKKKLGEN